MYVIPYNVQCHIDDDDVCLYIYTYLTKAISFLQVVSQETRDPPDVLISHDMLLEVLNTRKHAQGIFKAIRFSRIRVNVSAKRICV